MKTTPIASIFFASILHLFPVPASARHDNGSGQWLVGSQPCDAGTGRYACATPVGVNPYVSYANNTAVTSTSQGATALVPVASSYTFGVPAAQIAPSLHAGPTDSDASMEAWMQGLSQSIGSAFLKEMVAAMKGVK